MYGRNGAGFVLVFKGEALAQLALVDFLPVSYEPPEQRAKMERVIKIAKETTSAANDLARRKGIGDFQRYMRDASAHAFGSLLALHSAGMKGPRHGFEGEWRMMVSYIQVDPVGEQLPFEIQASGPVLRSYYERSFPKTALLEVIVGAKHYDLNEFVVAALLEKYGYSETKIRRGEVNIRGAEGT
jgi:hypothetical protein